MDLTAARDMRADVRLDTADRAIVATLLEVGERAILASPAEATMPWAGVVALAYAVPVLTIAWFPLRKVADHADVFAAASPDRWFAFGFAAFGLLWLVIGLRLLYEPVRLKRLYPHVFNLLTDRRLLSVDRRHGPIYTFPLAEVYRLKTLSWFGRVTLYRTGLVTDTGRRARFREFDGLRDPEGVAQTIAELTGVPVGITRETVQHSAALIARKRAERDSAGSEG